MAKKTNKKRDVLNSVVRMLCGKDGGKKQLNAGEARRVVKALGTLLITNEEFITTFGEYLHQHEIELHKKARAK